MFDLSELAPRQRWMIYGIYAIAGFMLLGVLTFFTSLRETRAFIGDRGVEYCWMYGAFHRYLYINLAWFGADIVVLFGLIWLAQRNHLLAYLLVVAIWLFGEPILSLFDMSYC